MRRVLGVAGFPGLPAGFPVFLPGLPVIGRPAVIVLVDAESELFLGVIPLRIVVRVHGLARLRLL